MNSITKFLSSSVGKKYLMSVTGLALVGFLVAHLLGNLQLLIPKEAGQYYFNAYGHHLEELKLLVIGAEIGLIALILVHIIIALAINFGVRKARPVGYHAAEASKGGDSRMNLSSTNMLVLGIVAAVFIVIHVWTFKFGPGHDYLENSKSAYKYVLDAKAGTETRDLFKMVVATFSHWYWVLFYVGSLVFIGFHLRHGVWSAFQSLGAMPGAYSKVLYCVLALFGAALAVGFIVLPVYIFLASKMGAYGFLK